MKIFAILSSVLLTIKKKQSRRTVPPTKAGDIFVRRISDGQENF